MKKTVKLILLFCLALFACFLMFTACSTHTHAFGEWEIVQAPTYTKDGVKSRYCSCGEKQSGNIEKLTPQTNTLSSLECKNELREIYNYSIKQTSLWYAENDEIYAVHFTGEAWFCYHELRTDTELLEVWIGKSEEEYYGFVKQTDQFGITTQKCTKMPQDELGEYNREIEALRAEFLQCLADSISLIADCKSNDFECLKTTGETTIYQIKLIVDNEVENITITVVNGLITVYDHDNYTTATYTYDKVITLPNMADYQMQ